MKLTVNGNEIEFAGSMTGAELLEYYSISPATVVVELNSEIISRNSFLALELQDGDVIELVTLVGGG